MAQTQTTSPANPRNVCMAVCGWHCGGTMATLTMQTRHIQDTLDMLYVQYGCKYRIVSEKTVFVGKECEENKWIEIVVEPDESVSGG